MNFIVLDLEWNQSPIGKSGEVTGLPFEIIEIGAVRYDTEHGLLDEFHELVKPQYYKTLHFKTREVVKLRENDLLNARSFPEVFPDFLAWCGDSPAFCTWGPADLTELQRNIAFYHLGEPFPFPFLYYDIQKIFSIVYEDRKTRRSLENAVDMLSIEKSKSVDFHNALGDAIYTAHVMEHLTNEQILNNSSVDYYRTPMNRRQEIRLQYETYTKFVSKPFDNKVQAMKDRFVSSTTCYLCKKNAQKKIRWFSVGSHNYFCLAYCAKHGYLKGKIRLRQRPDERFYVVKTQKLISDEEAYMIRERKEIQTLKRRLRKKYKSETAKN